MTASYKTISVWAVGSIVVLYLLKKTRGKRRSKESQEEDREARETKSIITSSSLPICIYPAKLRQGWSVAPPLIFPPHLAVIPLVCITDGEAVASPLVKSAGVNQTESEAFIVCEEVDSDLAGESDKTALFQFYLQHSELLQSLKGFQIEPLFIDTTAKTCFTHYCESKGVAMLFGTNGSFVFVACLQGFKDSVKDIGAKTMEELKSSSNEFRHSLPHVVKMLVDASLMPTVEPSGKRLANTLKGAGGGFYSVNFPLNGQSLQVQLPPTLRVSVKDVKASPDTLFFVEEDSTTMARRERTRFPINSALFSDFLNSQAKELSLATLAKEDEESSRFLRHVKVRLLNENIDFNQVSVSYHQPSMGIFFSVHNETGVVFDPILVERETILYFPCGVSTDFSLPKFTIEQLTEFPKTWEVNGTDEKEVLLHNVKFHFTEWETTQTACDMVERSGYSGVQFTETKDGVTCRSVVIPRQKSILLMRWEVAEQDWQKYLSQLQLFLDTVHIDKVDGK
ncbi:hypothetical protein AGDE_10909 [Angomonas deanei]|uniref:Uncharacterized protein n=1 Tax=Angomonas deanei TaxID=59799 RepID=A0A7G2CA29_9TRYP|nr:hypothetical protein AGDE_10909 [Angomonas deanei]CAD2216720.1 hypothetical protein, conserved [Angomonas deanei]|eukprot:EPY27151.1 hypothetical protein AGDE_10909 [Angomonas deanei]